MTEPAIQQIEVDGKPKFSLSFPLTGKDGKPLLDRNGNPRMTNLVGDTEMEVTQKLIKANIEAAQTIDRANQHIDTLQNKKPTPKRAPTDLKATPLTPDEEMSVGLDAQDPRKAAAAIKKVVESVVPVARITEEVQRQGQEGERERRLRVASQFVAGHPEDYFNITANGVMMNKYIEENGLEYNLGNLEIAFAALYSRLARKPVLPSNDPPRNDAPGNDPPNPGTPPPPQRRAPVGGISNDQASGRPLDGQHFPYTRDQLLRMAYAQDPKYDELIKNPKTNAMVTAVLSGRR